MIQDLQSGVIHGADRFNNSGVQVQAGLVVLTFFEDASGTPGCGLVTITMR